MPVPLRNLLLGASLLGGCTNPISNQLFLEDGTFLEALPSHDRHSVGAPEAELAKSEAGDQPELLALTIAVAGTANGFIDDLLSFVDALKSYPPTTRSEDGRTWGPWAQGDVYVMAAMDRAGIGEYAWSFRAGPRADGDMSEFFWGDHYAGETVAQGDGSFQFDFSAAALATDTDASGTLEVTYDNREGKEILAALDDYSDGGREPVTWDYWFASGTEGGGDFEFFQVVDISATGGAAEDVSVRSRWTAELAGRGDATIRGGDVGDSELLLTQCWDTGGGLVYQWDSLGWFSPIGDDVLCAFADRAEVEHL